VDQILNQMIQEDLESMKLTKMKQEQSKQDMILSMNEKRALLRRQRELEQYEEEMVNRYNEEQQQRASQLQAAKNAAEAARDAIFNKLAKEEADRRAQAEYLENLRNELQVEELAEREAEKARREAEKRQR
jgi:hypothetical protein